MSDKPEGPGWWVASDGKWYPPELHPSARDDRAAQATSGGTPQSVPHRWQSQSAPAEHVGPQFPDLFQKAMQENHVADLVSVKYDGDDERNAAIASHPSRASLAAPKSAAPTVVSSGSVGSFSGAAATKRRWRRGH